MPGVLGRFARVEVALGAALLLLSACSPTFAKPGATEQDWTKDSYECERDLRSAMPNGGAPWIRADFYERCLAARGWAIER